MGCQRFGVSVQSEMSVLKEQCRLPFRVIQRYLKGRFGLDLSVGELVGLTRGVAERGREEYNRLKQEIRASPVVYADETGWRQDGRNGYLWSFSTPKVRYFVHRLSRANTVVKEVLGDEFEGVLVSDFYGAYNVYQGPHQRCWTHLLRDIHQLKERFPEHESLAGWSRQVREVYDRAQAHLGPDPGLPDTVRQAQRLKRQQEYQRQLLSVCKPYLDGDAPMKVLCQRASQCGQQRGRAQSTSTGGEPEDQRRHPFKPGKRDQEHPRFHVRHLALAWTKPLPRPQFHPLPTPTCPSLTSYGPKAKCTRMPCRCIIHTRYRNYWGAR